MLRRAVSAFLIVAVTNSISFISVYRMSLSALSMEKGYETTGVLNVLDDSVASHPQKVKDLPSIIAVLSERENRYKFRYQSICGTLDHLAWNSSTPVNLPVSALNKIEFLISYHSSLSFLSTLLI